VENQPHISDAAVPSFASSGHIDVSGLSHPGKVRARNEDHFIVMRIGRYLESVLTTVRGPSTSVVLAGPDVGFRMTAQKGDTPVGQLVVRINGEWKVVEFGSVSLPLGK